MLSTPTHSKSAQSSINLLKYFLLERQQSGKIIILYTVQGIQVWGLAPRTFKAHRKCVICKDDVKGTIPYLPMIGNDLSNFRERICPNCVNRMVAVYPNKNLIIRRKHINEKEHFIYAN